MIIRESSMQVSGSSLLVSLAVYTTVFLYFSSSSEMMCLDAYN